MKQFVILTFFAAWLNTLPVPAARPAAEAAETHAANAAGSPARPAAEEDPMFDARVPEVP